MYAWSLGLKFIVFEGGFNFRHGNDVIEILIRFYGLILTDIDTWDEKGGMMEKVGKARKKAKENVLLGWLQLAGCNTAVAAAYKRSGLFEWLKLNNGYLDSFTRFIKDLQLL